MWHTYGTWLPGDPRGFRDRHHRIHSSGDYKNPPPKGEHAGLNKYAKKVLKDEVGLATPALRREVCQALVATIHAMKFRLLVATVCRVHVHMVIELPADKPVFDAAMRTIKTKSASLVKHKPSQRLWAHRWRPVLITTPEQRDAELVYVRDRQGHSVCTWTHREHIRRAA